MFRNLTEDGVIEIYFETFNASGVPVAPSSSFTTADFAIYKNGSATAKATTNGITVTSPFNSETGTHLIIIDTSNDTGDSGFWTTGSRYQVKFNTAKTVDSKSIDGRSVPRGSFGIQSEYEGANVVRWLGSTPNALVSGRTDVSVGAYQSGLAPLQPTTAGRTLDVTATGAAGIDWANVENPTAANDMSGTYVALQNNQNVLNVTGKVLGGGAGVITGEGVRAGLSDSAITAAKFAADSITASALAADAAAEIGAATLSALGTGSWATAIPWNTAWDSEVQSECADAITAADLMLASSYTAPDNASILLIKASTDNLPSDPADQSLIISATDAVMAKLGTPAGASMSADIAAVKTDTGNLTTRIPSALFSGITSLADWIRRIARKDAGYAGMTTAQSEINTGGTATFAGTTDSLEAISDASGGGGGDALEATSQEILTAIEALGATALSAATWTAGSITGFPSTLVIGDSYIDDVNRHIKVYYRDEADDPITAIGSKNLTDEDFDASLRISQDNLSSVVTATCEWVPASGPTEGYLKVELPKDQTRRAAEGVAQMQLVFKWGTSIEVQVASQTVTWQRKI